MSQECSNTQKDSTCKDKAESKPNWFKIFLAYLATEPFREIADLLKGIPRLFKKPTAILNMLLTAALIELVTVNNRVANLILFSLILFFFLVKEWKAGDFRKWYKDKHARELRQQK